MSKILVLSNQTRDLTSFKHFLFVANYTQRMFVRQTMACARGDLVVKQYFIVIHCVNTCYVNCHLKFYQWRARLACVI